MPVRGIARWVGFAFALACSSVAFAQPAPGGEPSGDPVAEARARGAALVAEQRPREAEQVYLEAFEATGAPSLLRDVADARFAAGDGPGAVEALERFVAAVPEGAEADAARQRIGELQQLPASLEVASTPPGAEVRIDGQVVGVTPLTFDASPGEHSLEIALEGYATANEHVVLAFASRRTVSVELAAEAAAAAPVELEPAAPMPVPRDSSATPAVWALSSIAAATLLTGTVLGFKALNAESEFVLTPTESGADRGERYALAADISFGVAAASAVTAFVLWLKSNPDPSVPDRRTARVRFVGSPRGAGLGAQLEF